MASIKTLKKQISSMANDMAMATILSKAEIADQDVPKINELLAEIYNFELTYREKAHIEASIKKAKEIKDYYKTLYAEIQKKASEIVEKIKALN